MTLQSSAGPAASLESTHTQTFVDSVRAALLFLHGDHAANRRMPVRTVTLLEGDGMLRYEGQSAALEVVRLMARRLGAATGERIGLVVGPQHMTLLGRDHVPAVVMARPYQRPAAEEALVRLLEPATENRLALGEADKRLSQHQRLASARFFKRAGLLYGAAPADLKSLIDDAILDTAILVVDRLPGLVQIWLWSETAPDNRLKLLHSFPVPEENVVPRLSRPRLDSRQEALLAAARTGLVTRLSPLVASLQAEHPEISAGIPADIDRLLEFGLIHRVDTPQRAGAGRQKLTAALRPGSGLRIREVAARWTVDVFTACGTPLSAATIAARLL